MGPKKPVAQVSQDDPAKPAGQTHVPLEEQTPWPEHAGEHALDCMSRRDRGWEVIWLTSGTASQRMMRLLLAPVDTATHTFVEGTRELAARGVDVFAIGTEGSAENADWPE